MDVKSRVANYYPLVSIREDRAMRDWKNDRVNWTFMTPDYAARLLVMSALLRHRFQSGVLSPDDDDKIKMFLSEPAHWNELSALRKWQVGSINEFLKSDERVIATTMAYKGALTWHQLVTGREIVAPDPVWRYSPVWQTSFIFANDLIEGGS